MSNSPNSVIIIGAGLAGLTSAEQILKANPKAQVTLLEAMSGPGGRTRSVKVNGATFDLGAQWIGHPHTYVQELAKRANNQVMIQNLQGKKLLQIGSQKQAYDDDIPKEIGQNERTFLEKVILKIQLMAATVPLDHPRNCPYAIQWDSMTIHSWVQQNIEYEKIKRFFQLLVRSLIGCQTNEVSFLFFLWYVHSNHGLVCMMNTEGGLQSQKFVNGTQPLSFFLETQIKKRGGKIYYNSFVRKVVQQNNEVTVSTRNGNTYKAKYLIIAAPPPTINKIHFEPQLSRDRRFIANRYRMGAYSKMVILYDKQYWAEKGFSGQLLSDCYDGPVLNAYDQTKPKQNGELQPAIVILFGASIQQQWMKNKQQCKRVAVNKLADYFDCPQMLNPIAIEMKVWNEQESIGGAPCGHLPPGVLTKINNLRQPQGLIHWAGTETALISQGYMNGAIESGMRVSKQILERFKNNKKVNDKPLPIPSSKWYSQISTHKRSLFGRL